jgi:hypothetical protein
MKSMVPQEVLRTRIARIIAATRYPFVDQTDWIETNAVIANVGRSKTWSFRTPQGDVFPSIVVLHDDGSVREFGQVEMEGDVTERRVDLWRLLSERTGMGVRVKKFFVYVPEGREGVAERLLEDNGIEFAGLRTWAVVDGNLIVRPYKTLDEEKDHRQTGLR